MKRYKSHVRKARKIAARKGKPTKAFPFRPKALPLKGVQDRLIQITSLHEKTKINRIILVSGYGRAARRKLWRTIALTDGLTWQEYCQLENMLVTEAAVEKRKPVHVKGKMI